MYILSTDADQTVKRRTTGGGVGKPSAHAHAHTLFQQRSHTDLALGSLKNTLAASL